MSKMIERVAEAMRSIGLPTFSVRPNEYEQMARAAIEAMSEPTDEMVAAAKVELVNDYSRARYLTDLGIRKAIKAALKE